MAEKSIRIIILACLFPCRFTFAQSLAKTSALFHCIDKVVVPFRPVRKDSRKQELARINAFLVERFPQYSKKLRPQLQAFASLRQKQAGFQDQSEKLSLLLNEILLSKKRRGFTKSFWNLWSNFSSSNKRAPSGLGKAKACLNGKDAQFTFFISKLKPVLFQFLKENPTFVEELNFFAKVKFAPAGAKTYFGATTDRTTENPRVCINPEEAVPYLFPKIIHELSHAKSELLEKLNSRYKSLLGEIKNLQGQLEDVENLLFDFEDNLKEQYVDAFEADALMPWLSKMNYKSQSLLQQGLKDRIGNLQIYKSSSYERHSKLLFSLYEITAKNSALLVRYKLFRKKFDRSRYLDEHVAYIKEYLAAVSLSEKDPDFFCRLWVPSYQYARPVRFFETYLDLEKRLFEGGFSQWLAEVYTFETKSYEVDSLFLQMKGKKILDPKLNLEIKQSKKELKCLFGTGMPISTKVCQSLKNSS